MYNIIEMAQKKHSKQINKTLKNNKNKKIKNKHNLKITMKKLNLSPSSDEFHDSYSLKPDENMLQSNFVVQPLEKLNKKLNNKNVLTKKDMMEINITIKNLSSNLKSVCEKLSSNKKTNVSAIYSEKDKKCVVKASVALGDLITNMDIKKAENEETKTMRDNFFNEMQPTRHLILLNETPHQETSTMNPFLSALPMYENSNPFSSISMNNQLPFFNSMDKHIIINKN
jgi:hypothetical protein